MAARSRNSGGWSEKVDEVVGRASSAGRPLVSTQTLGLQGHMAGHVYPSMTTSWLTQAQAPGQARKRRITALHCVYPVTRVVSSFPGTPPVVQTFLWSDT